MSACVKLRSGLSRLTACGRPLELVVTPALTLVSVLLSVLAMSSRNWLAARGLGSGEGFAELSPWYLCTTLCPSPRCPSVQPPAPVDYLDDYMYGVGVQQEDIECFWMTEWGDSRFHWLTAVQHLEYWSLGISVFVFVLSLTSCVDFRGQFCPFGCVRPSTALLFISGALSVSSVVVFAAGHYDELQELSLRHPYVQTFCWPYKLRVVAAVLQLCALASSGLHLTRTNAGYQPGEHTDTDDDGGTMLSLSADDYVYDWPAEYGEQL